MAQSLRIMVSSPSQTYSYSPTKLNFKIGRSLTCEFNIPKEDLSREHCLFEIEGEEYFITDLNSKNGVCVDRVRISPNVRTKIDRNSIVTMANIYTIRISCLEIKHKTDMVAQKNIQEKETASFQLEERSRIFELEQPVKKEVTKSYIRKKTPKSFDSIKMIIGFLIIIAFIIYQAIGR